MNKRGRSGVPIRLADKTRQKGSVRLYEKRLSVSREESQDQATVGTKEAAIMENAIEFPPVKVMYGTTVYWTENVEAEQSSSFISSMGGACSEASGTCDFISRAFTIITGTWTVTVFIGALLLLPLLMSAIGVKYLDECPKEPKIPIYLLVGGSFGALKLVLVLWRQVKFHRYEYDDHFTDSEKFFSASHVTQMSLTVFLAVWFGFEKSQKKFYHCKKPKTPLMLFLEFLDISTRT
ncbi:Hypothetical predicted protein [Octopus vulgaris]|uniref:Uncharacterized protein n=1 Tax=Octopus vulgaris TaxID=6645 RepID=A0AA36F1I4_OCTVU|nr:Hypothetical predicted protein [Octopus vulgaris]